MESSDNQSDNSSYDINFLTGINWLLASNYAEAIQFFLLAIVESDPQDSQYQVFQSYAGLSAVILRQPGGLQHCRHVSQLSFHRHSEIQLNLACAEFLSNNRERGIQAFDNIDHTALSPGNLAELHSFFDLVGQRERDASGALKRDKFIQKHLSRIFRKKNVVHEDIESFIRETAEKRYKSALNDLQNDSTNQLKKQLKRTKDEQS